MTPVVIDVENGYSGVKEYNVELSQEEVKEIYNSEKCENNACKVDVDFDSWVANELEARIERFVDAVEADGRLKILGTTVEDYGECFILDDTRFDDAQTLFLVSEVLDKCVTKHMAARIVRCIIGEEKSIVLNGMTRINTTVLVKSL